MNSTKAVEVKIQAVSPPSSESPNAATAPNETAAASTRCAVILIPIALFPPLRWLCHAP